MSPRIGALFAGYGGLDMAVQQVYGGDLAWYSEIDKGALKILEHRFPDVPNVGDVTAVDWSQVEPVDVLTGGSPCQDLSHAGRRAGMTEGTRSNLWVAMREAIAQLRPRLVVWENVRGALSAPADSDLEPCPGCVGDRPGVSLRALGRVVGDLSELGYVGRWHGLRAADVGAPHGRWRVFLTAHSASDSGRLAHGDGGAAADARCVQREGWTAAPGQAAGGRALSDVAGRGLLPTPRATDGTKGGPNQRGSSGDLMLPSAVALLPTPMANEGEKAGQTTRTDGGQQYLTHVVHALLPTPAVNDMGEGKTVERWDEWTADMQAKHGNGNGHGKSLAIEAQRLLPTPRASDGPDPSSHSRSWSTTDNNLHTVVKRGEIGYASAPEGGPGEELRDLRDATDSQEVRERTPGGSDGLSQAEVLHPLVREHAGCGHEGCAALASAAAQGFDVSGLRNNEASACSPRGPEPREQRPGEPNDALRELSPEAALAGGPSETPGGEVVWGPYAAAIRRWEVVLGRIAPPPTILSTKGNPQLSPRFVEFLMGLPAGWVTDVPGITRNEALKALGNGVVPQQAAAALRVMASWEAVA